jgi:hypothetical protein
MASSPAYRIFPDIFRIILGFFGPVLFAAALVAAVSADTGGDRDVHDNPVTLCGYLLFMPLRFPVRMAGL